MNMMFENLLGIISLLIILLFVLIFSHKNPSIRKILLAAFFFRALLVILEQFGFIKLPDGNLMNSDADSFERHARWLSNTEGLSVLKDFFLQDSLLITRIISIFFTFFGESTMMAKSISVALGTTSVYLTYKLALRIWGNSSAKKAAWLMALFPTLILYSAITLREVYSVFFLLIALNGIAKFIENKSFTSLIQIAIGFYILTLFHGPLATGGFVFLFYFIIIKLKEIVSRLIDLKINLFTFLLFIVLLVPIIIFINYDIKLPYIGKFEDVINPIYLIQQSNFGFRGDASYPDWLIINENYEIFTKTILRAFYFFYSPFVWEIKKISHAFGFIDGTFYFVITVYLIKNWHALWSNPTTRIFLLILITYLIIYGLGIANFGTGFRHRSKFVVILILLAAPKLPYFIFPSIKKIYKI